MNVVEDSEYVIDGIKTGTETFEKVSAEAKDPFNASQEEFMKVNGLNPTLRKRIKRQSSVRVGSKALSDSVMTGYEAIECAVPPYNLDYLAKLYELSSPNYAAVNVKAANIVGLGYDFIESDRTTEKMSSITTADGKKKAAAKLTRFKRALVAWLDDINPEDTFQEVLEKVWVDYEATGNGYIEIGRTDTGEIEYIGHIPSTTVRVRTAKDGYVQLVGKDVMFFKNFGDEDSHNPIGNDMSPNEVIHIKNYTPNSGYYGAPDIIAAMTAVAGNEFSAQYNLDYFEHRAVPRYVITVKNATLSPAAEAKVTEFFATSVKGQNHRSLYVPLPKSTGDKDPEFKMEPVEASVQEASFDKYDTRNTNYILMAHRVPLTKVGLAAGVSLAVARDADKTFKEQVTGPRQRNLEKRLNRIIAEKTDAFILKLNELALSDEDTQSKIDERDIRNQIKVPNEVRKRRGLPPLPGGDKVVDLKPQQKAEAKAQAGATRTRDQERSANSPDTSGEARAPGGSGRQQA